jgi:hypothetical protein
LRSGYPRSKAVQIPCKRVCFFESNSLRRKKLIMGTSIDNIFLRISSKKIRKLFPYWIGLHHSLGRMLCLLLINTVHNICKPALFPYSDIKKNNISSFFKSLSLFVNFMALALKGCLLIYIIDSNLWERQM